MDYITKKGTTSHLGSQMITGQVPFRVILEKVAVVKTGTEKKYINTPKTPLNWDFESYCAFELEVSGKCSCEC